MVQPAPRSFGRTPPPIDPRDHVHDDDPHGSRFGDEIWDYQAIRPTGHPSRYANFTRIASGYRVDAKLFIILQGRPHHPQAVLSGVVIRRTPATMDAILHLMDRLSVLASWGQRKKLADFSQWTQEIADNFLEDLRAGTHRDGGEPNGPTTVRGYVTLLKKIGALAPLAEHPLPFTPWPGQSGGQVAGETKNHENATSPLAWETWRPLMLAADTVIHQLGPLIIEAHQAFRAARTSDDTSRGLTRGAATAALERHIDSGGRIPLHTGFGRSKHQARGGVNFSQLTRTLDLSANIFKRTSHNYNPDVVQLVDDAVAEGKTEFGGLIRCDGTWAGEIGLGEAEHLPSILRAACYIMIASLSGMRDSELQALRRSAFEVSTVIPSVSSMTYKSLQVGGKKRSWWVPGVVQAAVETLERLSLTDRLFSRSGRSGEGGEGGQYSSERDIERLITFVNAAPEERAGRGGDLGLPPIVPRRGDAINATSLRRTLAVYAATYPGAEIGVGIQLGKASLRATGGYIRDRNHAATEAITDERVKAVKHDLQRILFSDTVISGPSGDKLENLRVQVITDPARANQLISRVAQNYHLGVVNDCLYREKTAACGPGGPKLADHFCASGDCPNAVIHAAHLPVLDAQLQRYDNALDTPNLHPGLESKLRRERERVAKRRRHLQAHESIEDPQ